MKVFNTINWNSESKEPVKHVSSECRFDFDSWKCYSKEKWNNDQCHCKCKKPIRNHIFEEDYTLNPIIHACGCDKYSEIGGYLKDIQKKSYWWLFTCNEIGYTPETTPIEFVDKKRYNLLYTILSAIICLVQQVFIVVQEPATEVFTLFLTKSSTT